MATTLNPDPTLHAISPRYLSGLDPEFVKYYNKYNLGHCEVQEISIKDHRNGAYELLPAGRSIGPEVGKVTELSVPVKGGTIIVRVYEPKKVSESPRPCYINLHGGGWVLGGGGKLDKPFCLLLVHELGCVAFDVDYR